MQYSMSVIRIYLIYVTKPPISLLKLIFTPITRFNHCIKYPPVNNKCLLVTKRAVLQTIDACSTIYTALEQVLFKQ